jgi:hypothetical protein
MVRCLTSAKFTMDAEVLTWTGWTGADPAPPQDSTAGEWATYQDPITLEVRNVWRPTIVVPDNPNTPEVEQKVKTIECLARGIVSSGIRTSGTTEAFGEWYRNVDLIQMWIPAKYVITKRDRVTNIREKRNGKIIWIDEEYMGTDGPRPTIFNVTGVTPLLDPFNRHTQNLVFLERAGI